MQTKSGKSVFPIGIGTWDLAGKFTPQPSKESAAIEAIHYSLSKGQNHIDCAELYGGFYTDEVVGKALAGCTRADLYIADKLGRGSVERGKARPTVEKMLQKLGTDYLDLLYIHAPWPDVNWQEAIPQIDELIDEGLVRAFGVSNFTVAQMQQAQALSKHPIIANQMNYNVLYKTEVTDDFRAFCRAQNIQIVAYQPVKRQEVLTNAVIQEIAAAHDATPAQVALAWLLAKDALPIPKAASKPHIDENVAAVEIQLTAEEVARLDSL
jgi:diketogulonate reductase-like aldo/keto reductase